VDYLSVAEARSRPGLRLVLSAGVPGPWGEAAKALLQHKGISFMPVRQEPGGSNEELLDWTGQSSAPVLVPEHGPAVSHWLDLLLVAEQLAPSPALLPQDLELRTQAIGLCTLIAGVDGFGWQRRLQLLAPGMESGNPPETLARLAWKYGWNEQAAHLAQQRLAEICHYLDQCLAAQQASGSDYFVGTTLSAVDIYWANFVGMISPLPAADNPMPEYMRATYSSDAFGLKASITERLLAHRDYMYQQHLELPLVF